MTRRIVRDWATIEKIEANTVAATLRATLPEQWAAKIDILAVHPDSVPFWRRAGVWRERLDAFKTRHGAAVAWSLSDSEVCEKARDIAASVGDLLGLWAQAGAACGVGAVPAWGAGHAVPRDLSEVQRLDIVRAACDAVGVAYPVAITAAGAIARGQSETWWRRVLRKQVARIVEHGAIVLGVVNRRDGAYASNNAVTRRGEQVERNAAMLKNAVMKNEAGQVFTLAKLAAASTANPDVRRGELMTRIRGCEEHADALGHRGVFFTLTCPSRFHAVLSGGKGRGAKPRANPKYQDETPRDAQAWLNRQWARVRAEWARLGVKAYGFRVAEPHHDACPHWHALLWFEDGAAVSLALPVVQKHWLSDDGGEPGAAKNRVNVKGMTSGSAAGYIAKYIAKNIAGGSVAVDGHTDDGGAPVATGEHGAARVDAWASTWGIRQFQAIGQPSVTVWREMRRVTKDQVEAARIAGDVEAWKAWGAVHKDGALLACWRRFMGAMGGVCLRRKDYKLQPAKRINEVVNGYGETITQKTIVGVALQSGRWLVSRRQAWARVTDGARPSDSSAGGTPAPWSGFNNCTARLGGTLRAALLNLRGGAYGMGDPHYLGA